MSPLRTLLAAPAGVIALAVLVAAAVLLVAFGVEVGSALSPVVNQLGEVQP